MAGKPHKLELACSLCHHPLTSTTNALTEEVLGLIAEQNVLRKTINDNTNYNRHVDIDKDQVVATKCGHMFHMGCIRGHVKIALEKKGVVFCPICTKPIALTRIWPVLIPPTPSQAARYKQMNFIKDQNVKMKAELAEMRIKVQEKEKELNKIKEKADKTIDDIQVKQRQLDQLTGPTDEELEELRRIHEKRQAIVRVVTKHNADLLEILMKETNHHKTILEIDTVEHEKVPVKKFKSIPPQVDKNPNKIKSNKIANDKIDKKKIYDKNGQFEKHQELSTTGAIPCDSFQEMYNSSRSSTSTESIPDNNNNNNTPGVTKKEDQYSLWQKATQGRYPPGKFQMRKEKLSGVSLLDQVQDTMRKTMNMKNKTQPANNSWKNPYNNVDCNYAGDSQHPKYPKKHKPKWKR